MNQYRSVDGWQWVRQERLTFFRRIRCFLKGRWREAIEGRRYVRVKFTPAKKRRQNAR